MCQSRLPYGSEMTDDPGVPSAPGSRKMSRAIRPHGRRRRSIMEVSLAEIVEALRDDDPDYGAIAERVGPAAMPHLLALVTSPDPALASRSVRLSGYLCRSAYRDVLHAASLRPERAVRVSAARGLAMAADFPREVAHALLDDAETD